MLRSKLVLMRLSLLAAVGWLLVAAVSAEVLFQEKFDGELPS